ncbi:MAG: nucleotidyl transferase AbiEii/AbiGii toxin family protein [Lachnospiraceae bacterium]
MDKIAKLSNKELEELFRNTAKKMKMSPAIIEKDFWVCYMLDYLFHRCKWSDSFAFKGGTSLSKAYNLIERFSEDIDLILDWRLIGYGLEEPWLERSNTQQDLFNEKANNQVAIFLEEEFLPVLIHDLNNELGKDVRLYINPKDKQTIDFVYPQIFSNPSILQEIRLEIGALAAWTPAKEVLITSYAAEQYPQLFSDKSTSIYTVMAERTFWEKVTILHKEANRISGDFPQRYSRHYYDLYCMSQTEIKENAFKDLELLKKVVDFKTKFYKCKWAKYEEANVGTIKLVPNKIYLSELEQDYLKMRNMMFGKIPEFSEIMKQVSKLEESINFLKVR